MVKKITLTSLGFAALFFSIYFVSNLYAEKGFCKENLNDYVQKKNLWNGTSPLRLHLGCGQSHFSGYINIDFPPSEHTVQNGLTADVYADITKLQVTHGSIDEIRSHHVFEHFDRSAALALLCEWYLWLKPGGVVVIETPDFEASAQIALSKKNTYQQRQVALRHLFGSHEAHWAIHCDGWCQEKFTHVLSKLGFTDIQTHQYAGNRLIPNVVARATKMTILSKEELATRAKQILRDSMVNNSEQALWLVWCTNFDAAFKNS